MRFLDILYSIVFAGETIFKIFKLILFKLYQLVVI